MKQVIKFAVDGVRVALGPGLALGLASCSSAQQTQLAAFAAKAAPVIQNACAAFARAESNPVLNLGVTVTNLAVPQAGMILGDVKLAGDVFCATGPAAGSSPSAAAQAQWLAGLTQLLQSGGK